MGFPVVNLCNSFLPLPVELERKRLIVSTPPSRLFVIPVPRRRTGEETGTGLGTNTGAEMGISFELGVWSLGVGTGGSCARFLSCLATLNISICCFIDLE